MNINNLFLLNGLRLGLFCLGFVVVSCDFTPYEDYYNQAIDHSRKGNYKEALYYINKSIKQNANITDAYFLRADVKIALDDWEGALLDYQQILKRHPEHTIALYSSATVNGRLQNTEKAIALYSDALKTPGAIDLGTKFGSFYLTANLSDIEKREEQMYKVEIQFSRGQAYLSNLQYDEAISDFNQVTALAHFEKFSHYNLGNAYLGKKDSLNACMHFIESAKLGYDKAKEKLKEHCI